MFKLFYLNFQIYKSFVYLRKISIASLAAYNGVLIISR